MNKFKITLEAKGHNPQVLTEKDENIRAIVDAWLYMFEQSNAAQQSVHVDEGSDCNCPAQHAYMTYVAHDDNCPARLRQ